MVRTRRISRAATVAALLAASVTAPTPASGVAGFGDVPGDRFFAEAVQWMVDNGITTGTTPSCFSPDDPVTRGQAAAFMWRMEGEPAAPTHSFSDVTAAWQQDAVSWMAATGITTGTTPTTYSPDDPVTRGQLAALLHRLAGEPAAPAHSFSDVTAAWQQDAVSWMAATGITTGTTPTTYSPDDPVTRGQLATFFHRYAGDPAVVLDPSSPPCGGGTDDEFGSGPLDLTQAGDATWTIENGHLVDRADIDLSAAGRLVLVPTQAFHNGWYASNNGPIVYQETSGDFAAAIRIRVVAATDPVGGSLPGPGFNSGGFLVRDASDHDDWVMYNMGNQAAGFGYGREVKTTVDASSVLNLYPQGSTTHRLLVCRVGSEFHYFHGDAGNGTWAEEVLHHERPDIGSNVHVGIIANAWEGGPPPWVEVDAIHFGTPTSVADCTSSVDPV